MCRKILSGELLLCVPDEREDIIICFIREKVGHMGVTKCVKQI